MMNRFTSLRSMIGFCISFIVVNLNINVLISTPVKRPPFLKGHLTVQKGRPHKRDSTVLAFMLILTWSINDDFGICADYLPLKIHGKQWYLYKGVPYFLRLNQRASG